MLNLPQKKSRGERPRGSRKKDFAFKAERPASDYSVKVGLSGRFSGVGAVAGTAPLLWAESAAAAAQAGQVGSGIAASPQVGQVGIPHGAQAVQTGHGAVASASAPKRPETMQRTPRTEPRRTVAVPQAAAPILTIGPGGQTTAPSQAVQDG